MNSIFRKIVFRLRKVECYVYGIDSLGATNSVKTLIYKNGDEYIFDGFSESAKFHLVTNSIKPKQGLSDIRDMNTVKNDLIDALRRYGFVEIICIH